MRISSLLSRALMVAILAGVALSATSATACPEIKLDPTTGLPIADPELQAALDAIEKTVDLATEAEKPTRRS